MKKTMIVLLLATMLIFTACGSETTTTEETTEDTSLIDVQTAGILTVGSDVPYPPMEFYDEDGNIVGVDIDVINEVAKRLGVETEINVVDWDDIFDAAANKEYDVIISSITITAERQEILLFSTPYFNGGQVLVVKENSDIMNEQDLSGRKVGVQTDTTGQEEAEKLGAEIVGYSTLDSEGEAIDALINGEIDAIVVDYIVGAEMAKENAELIVRGEPFTNEYYGIATAKTNNALMQAINSALRDMASEGELANIEARWLN